MSPEKVEVAAGLKLMKEAPDCRARRVPGVVVPNPRRPKASMMTKVEVADPEGVGDSTARRGRRVAVEVAETESRAKGEEVAAGLMEREFPEKSAVEVAVSAPKVGEVVAERVKVYVLPDWDAARSA